MSKSSEIIKDVILNGTPEEKQELFAFTVEDSNDLIIKKFELFTRTFYLRYFQDKQGEVTPSPAFHRDFVNDSIDAYKGHVNVVNAGSRDIAKTTIDKLFLPFVLLNDRGRYNRYIKVISKDISNAKQMVTDVYNMIIEVIDVYGDVFEQEGKKKREQTQSSFTMKSQVKVVAGTIGNDHRGALQDAYRPDFILFEDIEDRTSISSALITEGNKLRAQEALDGMAKGSKYKVNCNYISEDGLIQWLMDKESTRVRITPIATDVEYGTDNFGKKTLVKATPTWSRYTFEDLVEKYKDAEDWYGEFMCDPSRTGDKFFDIDMIEEHMKLHAQEPKRKSGMVSYWGNYNPGHRYGQGSDHSEGVGLDSNTLIGFDFNTGEVVYTANSNTVAPDMAAEEFARVGEEFGNCIFAPEANNKCGGIVVQTLKDRGYPRLYRYEIKDKAQNVVTKKLGWETNRKTKTTMLMDFRRDFNDGLIIIRDINLLKEMKSYTNNDLTDNAVTGLSTRHFDLLMAACIAWQMKDKAQQSNSVKDFYNNLSGSKRTVAS